MLSCQSDGVSGRKEKEVIKQRRIILILSILLITMLILFTAKLAVDFLQQKRSEDIISSAQREADQIIQTAENDASEIITDATNDANEKAATITQTAEKQAESITQEAEVKADKILTQAVNAEIDEVQTLLAITEAEAGDQPVKGKAAVAATIKNRIKSEQFEADTIKEVVYAPGQFDTVSSGKINKVRASASTVEGVKLCLQGKDYSNGALYFYNPEASGQVSKRWFSTLQTTTVIGDHVFKK